MSQEEMSIFWEVTVSVILSTNCICTCLIFRTFSEIELFHCTLTKFLIRKRFYVLFLIWVFIVQVSKLGYSLPRIIRTFLKTPPSASMHFATHVRTWNLARLNSVQRTVQ
jgi:hypothetical protein